MERKIEVAVSDRHDLAATIDGEEITVESLVDKLLAGLDTKAGVILKQQSAAKLAEIERLDPNAKRDLDVVIRQKEADIAAEVEAAHAAVVSKAG